MKHVSISVLAGAMGGGLTVLVIAGISGMTAWWVRALGGAIAGVVAVLVLALLRSRGNGLTPGLNRAGPPAT